MRSVWGARRLVPLLATGLVGLGAVAGAVVGSLGWPGTSPSAWTSAVVAATEAAGTAHVTILTATTDGRSRGSELESGVVSFRDDAYRLVDRSGPGWRLPQQYVMIGVRSQSYVELLPAHNSAGSAVGTPRVAGLRDRGDALAQILGPLGKPANVLQVQDLGPALLDGRRTTRYRLTVAVHQVCASGASGTMQVWLDRSGRIVRATTTTQYAVPTDPARRYRSVETVAFSRFGAPVVVSAPPRYEVTAPTYTSHLHVSCAS